MGAYRSTRTIAPARVAFRGIELADLDIVVELDAYVFGEPRRAYFERRLGALKDGDRASSTIGVVAVQRGAVVGFVMGALINGEFGFTEVTALVDSIAVHPGSQRQRVGQRLADEFISACASRGARDVYTLINWNAWDMLKFFDSVGFTLAQTIPLRKRIGGDERTNHG